MHKSTILALLSIFMLTGISIVSGDVPIAGGLNRIAAVDDGTIKLSPPESNKGDDIILFSDIDNQSSHIAKSSSSSINEYSSLGYLIFDLSNLTTVSDRNLAVLKIYTENNTNIESTFLLGGRVLSMIDGTSPTGSFMEIGHIGGEEPGFALCDITDQIKVLQTSGQNDVGIFFFGDDLSVGTIESGMPAEIVVI